MSRRRTARGQRAARSQRNAIRLAVPHRRRLSFEPLEDRRMLAVITVNTPLDINLDGDGLVSLREAIIAANTDTVTDLGDTGSDADTIVFDPVVFSTPQTIALSFGELQVTESLTIVGPGQDLLTFDAQLQSRIFNITATTGEFAISGMTLTRGKTTGSGGAINTSAKLSVDATTITGNTASYSGGGIAGGNLTITDSTISGNSAISGTGGAISAGNLTLAGSGVSGNSVAVAVNAAAIDVSQGEITDSTITGNMGGRAVSSVTVAIGSSTVSDNSGGIAADSLLTITDSTISQSDSSVSSGQNVAIVNSIISGGEVSGNNVTLTKSTITGAITSHGGQVVLTDSVVVGSIGPYFGNVTVTNSTVDGRIDSYGVASVSVIHGSTITGDVRNSAVPVGLGLGSITLADSIVNGSVEGGYSDVSLVNSTISGGGISATNPYWSRIGSISLTNSTITGASSSGIAASYVSNIRLTDSVVSDNGGAGISVIGGDVSLVRSKVSGNVGGGVAASRDFRYGSHYGGDVNLIDSIVSGNSDGGIIGQGDVSLVRSNVSGNVGRGVAAFWTPVFGSFYGDVNLTDSLVSGNSDGGILGGSVSLVNSTVSGNSTAGDGGGIAATRGVNLRHSTVTDNYASGHGGGIWGRATTPGSSGSISLASSIVAGNRAGNSNPDLGRSTGGDISAAFSLIGDNAGTSLVEAQTPDANGNLIGSSTGGGIIDPRLAPLADNGGPTQTHALLPDSLAIDAIPYTPPEPPPSAAVHVYELNGTLSDALGGPPLVALGGTLTASGYQFGPNQGLNLSSADIDPGDYSIELVFTWDALSDGWQKIIDFHDLTLDVGLYALGTGLHFVNDAFASNVFSAGASRHLVLTRDDATDVVRAFVNGTQRWSFVDTAGNAVFTGPDSIIRFFQDDLASGQTEAQTGFVDRIRIFDRALTATEVAELFNPPPPPPPDIPPYDQRGEPFHRVADGNGDGVAWIDMGAYEVQAAAVLPGDFNGNGAVENGDLTLLLNHWSLPVPPVPEGWTGLPPTGPAIDNDELTLLLNNWGTAAGSGAVVAAAAEQTRETAPLALASKPVSPENGSTSAVAPAAFDVALVDWARISPMDELFRGRDRALPRSEAPRASSTESDRLLIVVATRHDRTAPIDHEAGRIAAERSDAESRTIDDLFASLAIAWS